MNKWISFLTPPSGGLSQSYITYRPNAPITSRVTSIWYDPLYNGWSGKYKVTYWMPLPEPPKGGDE